MKKTVVSLVFLLIVIGAKGQNYNFGKVSKEEVLEEYHSIDKEADAAVLFRDQKVVIEILDDFEFSLLTEVHERIKIYSKDGFDWATKEILLYRKDNRKEKIEEIEGVTYNVRNGKLEEMELEENGIFEEEMNNYHSKVSFTMPSVAEGSVIEFKYTVRSPFWSTVDKISLQETIPINRVKASMTIPGFMGYKMHFNPKSPITFEVGQKDKRVSTVVVQSPTNSIPVSRQSTMAYQEYKYFLEKDNIPGLKPEAYAGYLPGHAASLEMELQYIQIPDTELKNYALTWEGVSQSIFKEGNYKKELADTKAFGDDLKLYLKGVHQPEERARRIFKLVKKKVKWNGYYGFLPEKGIRKAYKAGEGNVGDVNVLLTSMMKYAGIKAAPVLVSTEKNGLPLYPTRNGFNYVICAVELEGQQYLLDATDPNSDFGELPSRTRNWRGRSINSHGGSEWVDLMPKKKSSFRTVLNLTFGEDLAFSGKTINNINGLYAKSYRDRFGGMQTQSHLKFLEKEKRNIEIRDLVVENEDSIGTDITETYSFLLKDEMQQVNDRVYFQPLLFERMEENPFKAEDRTLPIFFEFPKMNITLVNIKIPEGYAVESVPESVHLTFSDGGSSYEFRVTQNGPYLRVVSQLEWSNLMYMPEDYENIKQFYNAIVEKNAETIVLKKV